MILNVRMYVCRLFNNIELRANPPLYTIAQYMNCQKKTENALIEWRRKETTKYFPETKVYVVYLSLVFKTVLGIFLAPLVCLIRVQECYSTTNNPSIHCLIC
jgi:hypothetical protein